MSLAILASWREKRLVPLAEVQNYFTTKDTKSTKEEDEALESARKLGGIEVHQESGLHSCQLHGGVRRESKVE